MREWPRDIRESVGAGPREKVFGGDSADSVYRIVVAGGRGFHLKVAGGDRRAELRREREVLDWLAGRLGAPTVENYCEEGREAYLLMSSVSGCPAAGLVSDWKPKVLLAELTRALRRVHALPVESCPFDRTLSAVVGEAHRRAEEGRVHLEDFDDERQGWPIDRLQVELDRTIPKTEDRVFTHGDFCLPNILLQGGRVSGMVDWGRAGIADRYRDIALLLRSFGANMDADLQTSFCEVYGIQELDMERVRFYQLLDEFF